MSFILRFDKLKQISELNNAIHKNMENMRKSEKVIKVESNKVSV